MLSYHFDFLYLLKVYVSMGIGFFYTSLPWKNIKRKTEKSNTVTVFLKPHRQQIL